MANLKDLKNRISSVKSTQKITKAMQMVAASKLKRAQGRAEEARPYTQRMERMLEGLAENVNPDNAPALLVGNKGQDGILKDKIHLIVVVSSDKGLCGGFNGSVIKGAKEKFNTLHKKGKTVKIVTVGRKAFDLLRYSYENSIVSKRLTTEYVQPKYKESQDLADEIIAMFESGEIDSCSIVYNKFINAITQELTFQQLIPLDISSLDHGKVKKDKGVRAVCDYEPSEEAVLSELLPQNIAVQLFHALLESSASEQGARMTAMDNATRNAGDMIKGLTLVYNRTRQAAITTELIEIISGAEAL